mmetsp:Transcript_5353/g.9392  ORF Transcript_5353/g.9392 Transcript_5353/m.9392 type:complete len:232 (+) Transcript_5353:948-1643(+)
MLRLATQLGVGTPAETRSLFGFSQLAHVVNLHKALCFPVIGSMIFFLGQFTPTTAMYLGMHGSYGLCWIFKSLCFPDSGFDLQLSSTWFIVSFLFASVHWITSYIIICITSSEDILPQPMQIVVALTLFSTGIFALFTADCQKYFTLKYRPRTLIDDGVFSRCRNTNYLGEILIYSAYAVLANHVFPWIVLLLFFSCLFLPNMLAKDKSLQKYDRFPAYKEKSTLFIPKFW